ncbi:helix-turn-helix domain-containing protein [Geodermatophilus sp. CPCC 205506]|uniref:helix-turn-helix domain-containing protein n=1 Tax=Geodermatophilus sp. CPCC 205506 TaxID=2936596 RepID=UPI003F52CB29
MARPLAEHGLAGLEDLPRPGKPAQLPEALRDRVLELTLTEPPDQFGATHWSCRLLASALAGEGTPISHATIARIWHRFGVQPWRAQTFQPAHAAHTRGHRAFGNGVPASDRPRRRTRRQLLPDVPPVGRSRTVAGLLPAAPGLPRGQAGV